MIVLCIVAILIGLLIAAVVVLYIITRPEKRFDLSEDSYELLNGRMSLKNK